MRVFGRRRRFPKDMLEWLERLGRTDISHLSPTVEETGDYSVYPALLDDAKNDPDGFTADLRELVADDTAGFATYGASRLVWDLLSDCRSPAALALLDAAIAVKRAFGMPTAHVRGYEMARWVEMHGSEPW